MAEANVEWSVFEGLFVHHLKPQGAFLEDLKRIGLDLASPEPRYSSALLEQALDVAARHAYPSLAREQAYRELGRRSGEAFFETLVGKITGVAMPMLGPDRVIASLPRRVQAGTSDTCTVEKVGDKHWYVKFGAGTNAEFAAGNLESALRKTGITPTATVERNQGPGVTVSITW